eukprot:gene37466-18835_t
MAPDRFKRVSGGTPVPVVVDCDPGIDDALALMLLRQAEREQLVKVVGITTVFGNVRQPNATRNAVAALVADFVHGADGLGDADFVHGADGLGDADFVHGADGLGDADFVHGADGLGDADFANVWHDPGAADAVAGHRRRGLPPLQLVGLDATQRVEVSHMRSRMSVGFPCFHLHDPVAALAVFRPDLFRWERRRVRGIAKGQTVGHAADGRKCLRRLAGLPLRLRRRRLRRVALRAHRRGCRLLLRLLRPRSARVGPRLLLAAAGRAALRACARRAALLLAQLVAGGREHRLLLLQLRAGAAAAGPSRLRSRGGELRLRVEGAEVVAHGLTTETELNGRRGTVVVSDLGGVVSELGEPLQGYADVDFGPPRGRWVVRGGNLRRARPGDAFLVDPQAGCEQLLDLESALRDTVQSEWGFDNISLAAREKGLTTTQESVW